MSGAESDLEQLKKEVATLKGNVLEGSLKYSQRLLTLPNLEKHQNAAIQCGKFKSELEKEQNNVKEQTEQNSSLKAQVGSI